MEVCFPIETWMHHEYALNIKSYIEKLDYMQRLSLNGAF